jgi:hypothetical protein
MKRRGHFDAFTVSFLEREGDLPGASLLDLGWRQATRRLLLVGARQRDKATTWSHAARWSLMPRGIAAHYTTSATLTSEPTAGPERRAFRGSAISEVTKPSRRWCVTGALTRRRRVQYVACVRAVLVALPPDDDIGPRAPAGVELRAEDERRTDVAQRIEDAQKLLDSLD